jgi:cytochrome c oxidase assembly protein Cox11
MSSQLQRVNAAASPGNQAGTAAREVAPFATWWKWFLFVGVAAAALGAFLFWRYTAPVEVRLYYSVNDLPFDVQTIPPVVYARPGEMVSVVYRIRNNDIEPLEAFGRIEVEPHSAAGQIQVFLTQCGGLNTYQHSYPQDYLVFFRVQPAGVTGARQITLQHTFTRAAPPRP